MVLLNHNIRVTETSHNCVVCLSRHKLIAVKGGIYYDSKSNSVLATARNQTL